MLVYSFGDEFQRAFQVWKEEGNFLVIWFHIVNLLFLLFFFFTLTFSLPWLSWLLNSLILDLVHIFSLVNFPFLDRGFSANDSQLFESNSVQQLNREIEMQHFCLPGSNSWVVQRRGVSRSGTGHHGRVRLLRKQKASSRFLSGDELCWPALDMFTFTRWSNWFLHVQSY